MENVITGGNDTLKEIMSQIDLIRKKAHENGLKIEITVKVTENPDRPLLDRVLARVGEEYGVSAKDITGGRGKLPIPDARCMAFALLCVVLAPYFNSQKIIVMLGKDRTMYRYYEDMHEENLKTNRYYKRSFYMILKELEADFVGNWKY